MTSPVLVFGAVFPPEWLQLALLDAAMAPAPEKNNGLPEIPAHREYVEAPGKALAAAGQMDVPNPPTENNYRLANGPDQASPNPPGPGP